MEKELFKNAGLTSVQAEIYAYLLNNGENKAIAIAKNIKRPRGVVYKGLDELITMELVEKREDENMISRFRAEHPGKLEQLYSRKEKELKEKIKSFGNTLPNLVSLYNVAYNKPGLKFYEGIEGLKKIYNEILKEGKNFYLIRSAYEPVYKEKILPIVDEFIKKRIKKNIAVTAITPIDSLADPKKDSEWLMTRCMVDKEMYNAPVEIDIFGDKAAILSFGDELIGMIIESEQIAKSLKQIFDLAAQNINKTSDIANDAADNQLNQKNAA